MLSTRAVFQSWAQNLGVPCGISETQSTGRAADREQGEAQWWSRGRDRKISLHSNFFFLLHSGEACHLRSPRGASAFWEGQHHNAEGRDGCTMLNWAQQLIAIVRNQAPVPVTSFPRQFSRLLWKLPPNVSIPVVPISSSWTLLPFNIPSSSLCRYVFVGEGAAFSLFFLYRLPAAPPPPASTCAMFVPDLRFPRSTSSLLRDLSSLCYLPYASVISVLHPHHPISAPQLRSAHVVSGLCSLSVSTSGFLPPTSFSDAPSLHCFLVSTPGPPISWRPPTPDFRHPLFLSLYPGSPTTWWRHASAVHPPVFSRLYVSPPTTWQPPTVVPQPPLLPGLYPGPTATCWSPTHRLWPPGFPGMYLGRPTTWSPPTAALFSLVSPSFFPCSPFCIAFLYSLLSIVAVFLSLLFPDPVVLLMRVCRAPRLLSASLHLS